MANGRILDNELREKYMRKGMDFFASQDEEVMQTGSNEFAFPCVDSEGNDKWIQVVFKVPTGGRDEDGYDGYGMAESYQLKLKEQAEKKAEAEAKKAKKIAKDAEKRAKTAKNGD